MKYIFSLFLLVAGLTACQKANDKNPLLIGKWEGTEWLIMGKPGGMDASQVYFEFKDDGTYAAGFGNQQQSGVWRTEKEKLYTRETGKEEILVKIMRLDAAAL